MHSIFSVLGWIGAIFVPIFWIGMIINEDNKNRCLLVAFQGAGAFIIVVLMFMNEHLNSIKYIGEYIIGTTIASFCGTTILLYMAAFGIAAHRQFESKAAVIFTMLVIIIFALILYQVAQLNWRVHSYFMKAAISIFGGTDY